MSRPDLEQARREEAELPGIAQALIDAETGWADNKKAVHYATFRLWLGYGVRIARAYLGLVAERDRAVAELEAVKRMYPNVADFLEARADERERKAVLVEQEKEQR